MRHRALVGAGSLCLALNSYAQIEVRQVAVSGQPAPGTGPGVSLFSSSEQQFVTLPRITADGRVTFFAFLTGAQQGVDDQGIWTQPRGGALRLVARRRAAPGGA